jgi:peroxiredoxin
MTSKTTPRRVQPGGKNRPTTRRPTATRGRRPRWPAIVIAVVAVVAIGGLRAVFRNAQHTTTGTSGTSCYPYSVGQPGPGAPAPTFTLAATDGGHFDLASLRGKTVLLYFQEGLSCQPCWDQLTDLEKNATAIKAAGIDQVISITSDPINLIQQKVTDMHLSTTVLSDPDLTVSKTYDANSYGMMGASRDGHTFILVRPDGTIGWRADYGGAPKYTMFVPTAGILADLHAATASAGATP